MLQKLLNLRLKKRLRTGSAITIAIGSVATILALVMMVYMGNRYTYVLNHYAFPQGDLGYFMTALADVRSATRGAIGYEEQYYIDEMVALHDEKVDLMYTYLELVEDTLTTDEDKEAYDEIVKALDKYLELDKQVIELGATVDVELCQQAQELAFGEMAPAYREVYAAVDNMMKVNIELGEHEHSLITTLEVIVLIIIIAVLVAAVIVSFLVNNTISSTIERPINKLLVRLKDFRNGDISSPFPEMQYNDEVAEMVNAVTATANQLGKIITDVKYVMAEMADGNFNVRTEFEEGYVGEYHDMLMAIRSMNRRLDTTLKEVKGASDMVAVGASNLADASQALAAGATDQAASVEEMQATVGEITSALDRTVGEVNDSYHKAKECAEQAENSRVEMETMMEAMNRISDTSLKIGNIIAEIEDIASQTNLLSLNAAIEAARAGDAGRGFAVVADQIRTLAEQSAKSAVNTRQLIEGSIREVEVGNQVAQKTSEVLSGVVESIHEIAGTSQMLSEITKQQATAMQQAEQGIIKISEIVQANSATAEEASATSQELFAQATGMDEMVAKFKLRD